MTPGGASGYPTTLESLSHVADSLHTRRGRCETGEKETLRISTDYAGFSAMLFEITDHTEEGCGLRYLDRCEMAFIDDAFFELPDVATEEEAEGGGA